MPEGRRPPPGACEKPRAGTFAVARRKRRSAGERGLRMADGARVWASCFRSRREAQVGEREGLRMADAARVWASRFRSRGGSAGQWENWVCEWVDTANARASRFRSRGESAGRRGRGPANGQTRQMRGQSRFRSRPGSVTAIGIVGKTGSANAGKGMRGGQGKPLPGSGLCGGRGWGKNAWAGALRLRDRKNRAHEGCPPTVPHI